MVVWRYAALLSARRFMADQAGIRAVNQAVAALAENQNHRMRSSAAVTAGCAWVITGCCTKWKEM